MAEPDDKRDFDYAVRALQDGAAMRGTMAVNDAAVRREYQRQITNFVQDLRRKAETGEITWQQAATQASDARNTTMTLMRGRTSPIGRAMAEQLKKEGKTLNELIARYTLKRFGKTAQFGTLSEVERGTVFADILSAAARDNPEVTAKVLRMSRMGRGLIFVSLAISVYTIYTSDDRVDAFGKEVAVTGGGILAGAAGGALAGLACGPGAPVCVTIGAFVGAGVAAIGIDSWWSR